MGNSRSYRLSHRSGFGLGLLRNHRGADIFGLDEVCPVIDILEPAHKNIGPVFVARLAQYVQDALGILVSTGCFFRDGGKIGIAGEVGFQEPAVHSGGEKMGLPSWIARRKCTLEEIFVEFPPAKGTPDELVLQVSKGRREIPETFSSTFRFFPLAGASSPFQKVRLEGSGKSPFSPRLWVASGLGRPPERAISAYITAKASGRVSFV